MKIYNNRGRNYNFDSRIIYKGNYGSLENVSKTYKIMNPLI